MRDSVRRGFQHGADSRGHRHLCNGDEKPAVGNVVDRGHEALADERADEFAVAPLGGEIDRRRRPRLSSTYFAQVD